jgi:hypothetical protein
MTQLAKCHEFMFSKDVFWYIEGKLTIFAVIAEKNVSIGMNRKVFWTKRTFWKSHLRIFGIDFFSDDATTVRMKISKLK